MKTTPTKQILSLALRPRRLSSLSGQSAIVQSIRARMLKRPPQAWMFIGGPGCGKTTLARILAVAHNCTHQEPDKWGDPCKNCIEGSGLYRREESPDGEPSDLFCNHEINAAHVSGKEDLEQVARLSRIKPVSGKYRIFILDEFHEVSKAAQNLLLKPFEEPPPSTIWIICTSDPNKILPALRRRMTTFTLRGLSMKDTESFVQLIAKREGISRPLDPLLEQIHVAGISAPGLLLQILDHYNSGLSVPESVGGVSAHIDALAICRSLTNGKWLEMRKMLLSLEPEEVRWVQATVAGYLRSMLLRENDPKRQERAAISLQEVAPLTSWDIDNKQILQWLLPVLFRICKRYQKV